MSGSASRFQSTRSKFSVQLLLLMCERSRHKFSRCCSSSSWFLVSVLMCNGGSGREVLFLLTKSDFRTLHQRRSGIVFLCNAKRYQSVTCPHCNRYVTAV